MLVGFGIPVSGSWATPANQVEIARRAEELGYASLWAFQRLLFPADTDDQRWSGVYRSVLDPLVTLGFVAARTERIRLGVAVVNMPFLSPALLAKQAATVDVLSGGRLDMGLGLGWSPDEYTASNVSAERRGARGEEFVACVRTLWTDGPVSFDGDFYRVPTSLVEPKPVQRPAPPILLGGAAEPALRRAGRVADGWISSSGHDLSDIGTAIRTVREAAAGVGRDADGLRFVCRGPVRVRPALSDGEPRRPLTGTLDEIGADLDVLSGQGVTEVFADLNFDPEIGDPDADPRASMRRAYEVLEALAPRS